MSGGPAAWVGDAAARTGAGGRRRTGFLRLAVLGAVVVGTVGLTQVPVSGAFSAVTGTAASTASSAADFCTATTSTLYSSGDSWTDESNPAYIGQNDLEIRVRSSTNRAYVWTGFVLPGVPAHCDLVGAQLSYYNKTPAPGRNIDVYRGNPAYTPFWTAATITWGNQPPNPLGPAATTSLTTSTPGWQRWDVTAHVLSQYAAGNNGFVLMDREAYASPGVEQIYYDRQNATYTPRLVLTWG